MKEGDLVIFYCNFMMQQKVKPKSHYIIPFGVGMDVSTHFQLSFAPLASFSQGFI
jgi:hypothetical protein